MKATDKQVGGQHYKLPYQPIKFIVENRLNFIQGNIVKYVSRYKGKNGLQDLEKASHYAELGQELHDDQVERVVFRSAASDYCKANSFGIDIEIIIFLVMLKRYALAAAKIKALINTEYS